MLTTQSILKRHVFEFPFEIPAARAARLGRPRAKHPGQNNASEQPVHQQNPQREESALSTPSEKAVYRAKRRSLGLCYDCPNQAKEGRRYCLSCLRKHDHRIVQLRNNRKSNGLCQDCGKPAISGLTRCQICVERRRKTMRQLRARRRLAGICQNCSKEAIPEQNLCADCAEKQRARKRRKRQAAAEARNGKSKTTSSTP